MPKNKSQDNAADDLIIKTLKEKYFALAMKEFYPHSHKTSKELDNLQEAIRELLNKQASKVANLQ